MLQDIFINLNTKGRAMETTIEQFRESLTTKLSKIEDRLESLKSDFQIGQFEDKEAIKAKLKAAKLNVKSMSKTVRAAESKAKNWLKAKEKSGESTIKGWKVKFENAKLDRHAKSAEENADAAISLAEAKVTDAILAAYEAIDARISANESSATKH